ncbi:MAG: helix-turn-helix domain-containing protein, partial [Gammaproteobacteria bacterium]|nr:helix-turn-helix domain-containing protein [Gammaproteobacteria bacterium]
MVFPHIVIDETSLFILLGEISHYYQDALHAFPVLPTQYIDFALWQHDEIKSHRIQAQLNYWKNHLACAPTLSSFPTDKQRPDFLEQAGQTYSTHIDQSTVKKLREIRAISGMSQDQVGELIGVSLQQIRKYEVGISRISASKLYEFSQLFDKPISSFFDGCVADKDFHNISFKSEEDCQKLDAEKSQEVTNLV